MRPVSRAAITLLVAGLALAALAAPATAAGNPDPERLVMQARKAVEGAASDPNAAVQDPQGVLDPVLDPGDGASDAPGGPKDRRDPGFADRIAAAFDGSALVAGIAVAASALGLGFFALVTRYISPKEALKNPQRAMLYGFVRGNPGVHLKRLSEEFAMKTSSILWHIRKLECAELVRSERANGFRVFYPVEGGIEMKRVSRAITALQNSNARALFEALERSRGGVTPHALATRLGIHAGTVRWHLRKLREFGLIDELLRESGSEVFATPLGRKALQTLAGVPVEAPARPLSLPIPLLVE